MIGFVNALLECFVTGVFAALGIWGLAYLGKLPLIISVKMTQEEYDEYTKKQEEDEEGL